MPFYDHFKLFYSFLKSYLFQLNLFTSGSEDEIIIRNERRSTRLYLILLIISIIIIGSYYIVIPYTHTIIIKSPSFIEYLILLKEFLLECPCTNIAITYKEFVEIEPFYHELCESDFISNEYINELYIQYKLNWNNQLSSDFTKIGIFQFKTLRELCQLTQQTIEYHIEIFLQREFVQSQLISEELLQIQISSLLKNFINLTPKDFLRTLNLIQDITAQNLFLTGASVTSVLPMIQYLFDFGESIPYYGKSYISFDDSICTCSSSTATTCMGFVTFQNNTIPGFKIGCYMLNALLKSTLEVFSNQTFINILTNSINKYKKLNSSNSNSTIEFLLSQMFVTHWSNKTSFQQYFKHCAPDICQYTITEHYDKLFIITTIISLFGGLSSIFKILTPFFIMNIWPFILKIFLKRKRIIRQNIEIEVPRISPTDRIKEFLELIKKKLIELNLFHNIPPSQNENILRQQRYTTRIYLILLVFAIAILTLFTSFKSQTILVTIQSPTLENFIQLYDKYSLTLQCPCNKPAIDKELISYIKPEYHEICTSQFISSDWINIQFIQSSSLNLLTRDIRYQSRFHFQLLSTLCLMANKTIEDALQSFYQTKFLTNQLLNPQTFQIQIDLTIEEFKRTVPESFQRTLNFLKTNFDINQFITPMNSRFQYFELSNSNYPMFFSITYYYHSNDRPGCNMTTDYGCICVSLSTYQCYRQTIINENNISYIIPGMFQTWYPLQSLFISTLECFYKYECLSQITKFINSTQTSIHFSILNSSSLLLNNNQYETIEILSQNLFIKSWYNQSSFQSYFNYCNPLTCQYSYQTKLNLIYILTTILGFIGGFNVVLHLFLPIIIKLFFTIFNYIIHNQQNNITTIREIMFSRRRLCHHLHNLFIYGKKTLTKLNLFDTIPPSENRNIIQRNQRTTRIYLILLITTLFILILYTLFRQETIIIIVNTPSILIYKNLFSQYHTTLKCPCKISAIKYNKFISEIKPEYHEICSSIFVSSEWIESMPDPGNSYLLFHYDKDFHSRLRLFFQTLSKLCKLSQYTLNISLSIFKQTDFITAYLISNDEFNIQTELIIKQFKITLSSQFTETFKLIQIINNANQLASLFLSNWKFYLNNVHTIEDIPDSYLLDLLAQPETYDGYNCSCGLQSNCSEIPQFLFRTANQSLIESLPGFFIGCLPLNSLLQSNLICLYNKTCMEILRATTFFSKPISYEILIYSLLTMTNITIETLLNQLFVSQWYHNTSFNLYFDQCAPQSCHYSYINQYNPLYVITTLIAVFGGLTKGLRFILYYTALIIYKILDYRKKKKQVRPYSHQFDVSVIDHHPSTEVISNQITTTTVQFNINSDEEQIQSENRCNDRSIIIFFILLSVFIIIIVTTILFLNRNVEENIFAISTQTELITSSNIITESTSISTDICYMTLKYQSESYSTGLGPVSLVTGDFNQDSIIDLAVANFDSDTLSIILGNDNGTFQTQRIYSTGNGSKPGDITTADLNNDGLLDLAVVLYGTKEIIIYFGVRTNILFDFPPYSFWKNRFAYDPVLIESSDLDNDGFIDLIIASNANVFFATTNLYVFFNKDNGRSFNTIVPFILYIQTNIISIVVGDFDNDGKQNDIGFCSSEGRVYTLLQRNTTDLWKYRYDIKNVKYMYEYPPILIKGKFNDDDLDDIAVISSQSDTLQILLAYGNNDFTQQIYLTDIYPTSISRINFNNDSIDDLAILNCNGTITIFLGTNIGLFHKYYLSFHINRNNSGTCYQSLKVNDFNKDGIDDLVFIDTQMNTIRVELSSYCNQ